MAIEITIPRLGWSMEEGVFTSWWKQPGERVNAGDQLYAVESDKVTMDVESLDCGILHLGPDAPATGAVVRVGQCIGYLLADGEAPPDGRKAVTPRARRVAAELGVDVRGIAGTGAGGRVRERDVRAAAPVKPEPVVVAPLRRTIAHRMMQSRANTAPVTLTCRVDATNLVKLRESLKPAVSYTDIAVKLTAAALEQHPVIGGRWEDDRIVLPTSIDIAIAVDTDAGLLAPVIRNVNKLDLRAIGERSRALIAATRAGKATGEDLNGGVFTISNLGSYGIEAFTPMLNYPQTAVLGMGAIKWEAVVLPNGGLAAREQMMLSLTFDHRVVDGAPAARFLQSLAKAIEAVR